MSTTVLSGIIGYLPVMSNSGFLVSGLRLDCALLLMQTIEKNTNRMIIRSGAILMEVKYRTGNIRIEKSATIRTNPRPPCRGLPIKGFKNGELAVFVTLCSPLLKSNAYLIVSNRKLFCSPGPCGNLIEIRMK